MDVPTPIHKCVGNLLIMGDIMEDVGKRNVRTIIRKYATLPIRTGLVAVKENVLMVSI